MSPSGEWIAVAGPTRDRWDVDGVFALDLHSRESVRLGLGQRWRGSVIAFSGDGNRAAWPVPEGGGWRSGCRG